MQLNFARIADMYGDGATVNAVEHRLRPFRRMAEDMRRGVAHSDSSPSGQSQSRARIPRTPPTPKTPRLSRLSGASRSGSRTSRKAGTKKPAKTSNQPCDPILIEDDDDNEPAIKAGVKRENEETRKLLGINREALEDSTDEEDEEHVPTKRAKTESHFSVHENLLGIDAGRRPFVDSRSNGYVLPAPETATVKPEYGEVAKRLDGLTAGCSEFGYFHFLDEA